MRAITKIFAAAAVAGSIVAFAAPASAVTFANFTQTGTTRTVHWVRDANTGLGALNGTLFTGADAQNPGGVSVRFNFQLANLADFNNLAATFTVNGREVGTPASFTGPPDNVVTQTQV